MIFFRKIIYGLLLICVVSCSTDSKNMKGEQKMPVRIQVINTTDKAYTQEYIGVVEGEKIVDVSFQVAGNIEQIFYQEGQAVEKGQLLARLDKTALQSIYDAANATLKRAKDAYDRMKILYDNNSLPEIKYIEAQTALEQAEAAENVARKHLNDCNLYAPFSGIVAKRHLDVGANVFPGIPVYNLMTINTVKIKTAIPEKEISGIKLGQTCNVRISALNNTVFEGKVIEKGIAANPLSHTYDIKVSVNNKEQRIMPGMVCKVDLPYLHHEDQVLIVVPLKSIQLDLTGKHFVWIKDENDRALVKEVKLGRLIGNGIVIEDGLAQGDKLIVEGYQNITPNTLVFESETK